MVNLDDDPPSALPRGTRLGEFELKRVLGVGGFGIVYLAFDHALEREVAIKEYMPAQLAGRTASMQVSLLSQSNAESFSLGLKSFVNEARLLARFDHPSLVKVHRYWEGNQTAYMAMPYYTGHNLHAVRRQLPRNPDQAWLLDILRPLLGAVERLHQEGVYHRDISPDNIILMPDGRPVLLDFGAARRVLADKSVALTAILKPAYAPIEQYGESGSVKQGPWTDLYAMGATLHHLLLGRAPLPSTSRALDDEMPPLASMALDGCAPEFLACLDWMLKPRPADRPQSVAALRARLDRLAAAPATPRPDAAPDAPDWQRTQIMGRDVAPAAARADANHSADAPTLVDPSKRRPVPPAAPVPDPQATLAVPRSPLQAQTAIENAAPDILGQPGPPAAAWPAPETETAPAQRFKPGAAALAVPPAPATANVPHARQAHAPESGSARTEPTLNGPRSGAQPEASVVSPLLDSTAALAGERRPGRTADRPSERLNPRRWPLLAGVAGAAGLALWLGLKPAPAPVGAAASGPPATAASGTAQVAAQVAANAAPALAAASEPASLSTTAPAAVAAITAAAPTAPAAAALAAIPAATPVATPVTTLITTPITTPATAPAAPKTAQRQPPPSPKPAATAALPPAAPVAVPAAAPGVAPAAAGGPPSLATSITRLPPAPDATPTAQRSATADTSRTAATDAPAANSPSAAATGTAYPAPATAAATPGPATTPAPSPAPSPAPAPAPAPTTATVANVTVPRAAAPAPAPTPARQPDRDPDPATVQARAQSPSERCEGRVLVALWVCIERQCRSDTNLRGHPDCAKARREQEQRNAPR